MDILIGDDPGDAPIEVEAAGAVLVDGDNRLCLIHRPRYDDWSLPKGKLDEGESHRDAAIREVAEETGIAAVFVGWLADVHYRDGAGRLKRVRYAEMTATDGEFVANDETDAVEWLSPEEARLRLTYDVDVELVSVWAAQRGG